MKPTPSQREFQSVRDLARAFSAEVATTKGGSLGVRSGFIRMESNTDLSSPRRRGPSNHRAIGVYWMPAFVGMTAEDGMGDVGHASAELFRPSSANNCANRRER